MMTDRKRRCGSRGMALVVVLCFLALAAALVMALVSGITSEVTATRQDDGCARSRQLAELSVNAVMGQIRQATSRSGIVTWVSQPGMIRTYDSKPGKNSNEEIVNKDRPYDLAYYKLYSSNDMEVTLAEIGSFDPAGEVPSDWFRRPAVFTDLNAPCAGSDGGWHYPILDLAATAAIPGCRIEGAPVGTSNLVPMPVRWIYVLRDGTLTSGTGNGDTAVRWPVSGSTVYKSPSRTNPIVGRIAFWTDDETCKVNVNTASEGSYWDAPRANLASGTTATDERALALNPPLTREWQRYPGHPAATSLSAVFPGLQPGQICELAPRVVQGGAPAGGALTADRDRLYASIDELNFDAAGREPYPWLSQREIERARFCLTAHSRAPEVTIFGRPRISCWPISPAQSVYDKSVALCSSIGGRPYYFQRANPHSATEDIGLTRNQELFSYMQNFMSVRLPGYGQTPLASKFSGGASDQVLTEIFDYIRCTNLNGPGSAYAPGGWVIPSQRSGGSTMGFGRAFTLGGLAIGFICNADGTDAASNRASNPNLGNSGPLASDQIMVQAAIVPDLFCVAQGWGGLKGDLRIKIAGLQNLKLEGRSLFTSGSASIDCAGEPGDLAGCRSWGGAAGWRYAVAGQLSASKDFNVKYPLASRSVTFTPSASPGSAPTMNFSGGTLTVQLCSLSASISSGSDQVYQTFTIKLPPASALPLPKIAEGTDAVQDVVSATGKEQWWTFSNFGPGTVGESGTSYTPGRVGNAGLPPGKPGERLAGAFFREDCDIVRGVFLRHGDYRLVAARKTVNDANGALFVPLSNYNSGARISCVLGGNPNGADGLRNDDAGLDGNRRYFAGIGVDPDVRPCIVPFAAEADRPEATGDFDNGIGDAMDGSYINKPDEGDAWALGRTPYFERTANAAAFSPNRMIPSPGMFGSLPTDVKAGTPWKTLLFRPQGSEFAGRLPGPHPSTTAASMPPDHLLLDLFWMPVVEPYAISEPFSTAGKVNLNYQIVPFTYIERSTALRAVLKAERLGVIPNGLAPFYKNGAKAGNIRREIDADETLRQFAAKFSDRRLFRTASEICDLHIVPEGGSVEGMPELWSGAQLTGDNLRERIYATLYPRLTTRSNTFTVHYRVQVLKQVPLGRSGAADWAMWSEARDKVLSELRGSTVIERYVDPNQGSQTPGVQDDLPDFACPTAGDLNGNNQSDRDEKLDDYYRFRVIGSSRFMP